MINILKPPIASIMRRPTAEARPVLSLARHILKRKIHPAIGDIAS